VHAPRQAPRIEALSQFRHGARQDDRQKPRFGARVNTREGDKIAWADYIELAVADPRVWTLAEALFADQRQPVTMIASVLEVRRRLTDR
jgi:hypothetical protein